MPKNFSKNAPSARWSAATWCWSPAEVQRLPTQLDQYTDLTPENTQDIESILPKEQLKGFRGAYIETAQRLKQQQGKTGGAAGVAAHGVSANPVDQLDFEFDLFASALIDYDYIIKLIAKYSQQTPGKSKMSRDQLIGLIASDAKFMDERELIADYVRSLAAGKELDEQAVREGYQQFKAERNARELASASLPNTA